MPAPAWCQGIDADEPSVTVFAVDPRRFVGVLGLRTDQAAGGTSPGYRRQMELRRITPEDAQAAHEVTMAGFRTYHAFAPRGWQPPPDMGAEGATKRLAREGSYGVVAVDVDAIVGFAAYEPAREETDEGFAGPLIPGLAHVWAVF
jgi:hypothetical protein